MQYDGLRAELARAKRALQQLPDGTDSIVTAQQSRVGDRLAVAITVTA